MGRAISKPYRPVIARNAYASGSSGRSFAAALMQSGPVLVCIVLAVIGEHPLVRHPMVRHHQVRRPRVPLRLGWEGGGDVPSAVWIRLIRVVALLPPAPVTAAPAAPFTAPTPGSDCTAAFRAAYENRYTWDPGFAGYRGRCVWEIGRAHV